MTSSANDLLTCLYGAYRHWLDRRYTFACGPGCSTCCTSSVTMTTLEGRRIMDFLAENGRLAEMAGRLGGHRPKYYPAQTTNQFAASCLTQTEPDAEPAWDLAPCPFLADDLCTIYPIRPFGCRAFASTRPCREQGSAELDPLLITVNTIMLQIIEHLDSSSGLFGNLVEVLQFLLHAPGTGHRLLTTRPNPGFLVLPKETKAVAEFLGHLNRATFDGAILGRALTEFGVFTGRGARQ